MVREPYCAWLSWVSGFRADPGLGCLARQSCMESQHKPGRASGSQGGPGLWLSSKDTKQGKSHQSSPTCAVGDSPWLPLWGRERGE